MTRETVKIAEDVLVMARQVLGGMLEPPPAMVDELTKWALAKIAARRAFVIQKEIEYLRENQRMFKSRLERGELQSTPPEDFLLLIQERIALQEKLLGEQMKKVRASPRKVQISDWKVAKKRLRLNLEGWKYNKQLMESDKAYNKKLKETGLDFPNVISHFEYAKRQYQTIQVEMKIGKLRGGAPAYWNGATKTIRISVPFSGIRERVLRRSINHELTHFGQWFLQMALESGGAGQPSKKIRTPTIRQHMKNKGYPLLDEQKEVIQRLKGYGLNVSNAIHHLDDIEFYTDLADEIDRYREESLDMVNRTPEDEALRLRYFVQGDRGKPPKSHFFKTLMKSSRPKWQKAVKEFYKAVR